MFGVCMAPACTFNTCPVCLGPALVHSYNSRYPQGGVVAFLRYLRQVRAAVRHAWVLDMAAKRQVEHQASVLRALNV